MSTHPQFTVEQYGQASDGTALHWNVYSDGVTGTTSPIALVIHGGGYKQGSPLEAGISSPDLNAAGYLVLAPEYLLAAPGLISGQSGSGCYPEQTKDLTSAILKARSDPRGNGYLTLVGGSAGAAHALYLASQGVQGVDQPDCVACLSPATQLDDPASLLNGCFKSDGIHYVGNNASLLNEASANSYISHDTCPTYIAAFVQDAMPAPQFALAVSLLATAGVHYQQNLITGQGHSWDAWPIVKAELIAYLDAHRP